VYIVAGSVNDLYKEFPEKANEIIEEWKKEPLSKETMWIILIFTKVLAYDTIRI
jgi:3-methyladenine DNA glycosylase AlkC